MVKPKKENEVCSNWAWIFCIALFGGLVASITMHELMYGYNTPENTYPTCIPDGTCTCNSLNDVIVDIRISEINYTYTCWVETGGDILKHKIRNAGKNEYKYSILKITNHQQYRTSWIYKNTMFSLRKTEPKYDSNIYTTPYFEDYIETMLNLSLEYENQKFKMICEATPNSQNIEYTIYDEGYKETYTVPIKLPHHKIMCEVKDTQCKNKCNIINSCHIIYEDGTWRDDDALEIMISDTILRTVRTDVEWVYR